VYYSLIKSINEYYMYDITSNYDNIFYSMPNIIMYFEINKDIKSTLLNNINDYRDKLIFR